MIDGIVSICDASGMYNEDTTRMLQTHLAVFLQVLVSLQDIRLQGVLFSKFNGIEDLEKFHSLPNINANARLPAAFYRLSFNMNLQKKISRAFLFESCTAHLIFVVENIAGFSLFYLN